MNVISFSIWGNDPLYSRGMIENIKLAPEFYPEWEVWIYHDDAVNSSDIDEMKALGAKTILMPTGDKWEGLVWRFLPASDPTVDAVIVRDADSRLNSREKAAVLDWGGSGKEFHVMRDHCEHNTEIMGGMWGCTRNCIPNMKELISEWDDFSCKGSDQEFLKKKIWPLVRDKTCAHDRYPQGVFRLPDGSLIYWGQIRNLNREDNCGEEKNVAFPHGRLTLKDGRIFQRLDVYEYDPERYFGTHQIRAFPDHEPMRHGVHVGEIIR